MLYTKKFKQAIENGWEEYSRANPKGRRADIHRTFVKNLRIEWRYHGLKVYYLDKLHKQKISDAQKGEKGYWHGTKMSKATREKMSNSAKGKNTWSKGCKLTKAHKKKISDGNKGKKISQEHKDAIGKKNSILMKEKWAADRERWLEIIKKNWAGKKGSDNASWKGGITPLHNKIRSCSKYRDWVYKVFKKDNFTCQICDRRGSVDLTAHHKKYFAKILKDNNIKNIEEAIKCKELWNVKNGKTMCSDCHKYYHKINGK